MEQKAALPPAEGTGDRKVTTLELQFAAGRRFVEAVRGRIWVQDLHPRLTAEDYLKRCGEFTEQLPRIVTPEDVEHGPRT